MQPWQNEFACLPPPDEELDDEFGGLNVIYPKVIPDENFNKTKRDITCETGWATSDRTIHCKDDSNQYIQTIRFHVPLALSFTKPDPGQYLVVNSILLSSKVTKPEVYKSDVRRDTLSGENLRTLAENVPESAIRFSF